MIYLRCLLCRRCNCGWNTITWVLCLDLLLCGCLWIDLMLRGYVVLKWVKFAFTCGSFVHLLIVAWFWVLFVETCCFGVDC